jgi:hypothetical protein
MVSLPAAQRPISKVRLTVQPEISYLDAAERLGIWIAVTAEVEATLRGENVPLMPLNLVVILDNSAYATSDALKSACRYIIEISSQMRHPYDRLAIVCTTPAQAWAESRSGYTLRQLSAVDLTAIQKDLRLAIHARADSPPQRLNMQQTLADAFYILANGEDMERTGGRYCHVAILSTNAEACCNDFESAPVPIHVIQPVTTAWRQRAYAATGHLIVDSGYGTTAKEKIASMLDNARARTMPGRITNLRLRVEAVDPGCTIEEVIGEDRLDEMTIGQGVNMMIRVRLDTGDNQTVTKADALFTELESMLGVSRVNLVKITMTYNHSVFRDDTLLKNTVLCSIPRQTSSTIWSGRDHGIGSGAGQSQPELHTYCKLLLIVAASFQPREALRKLQSLPPPSTADGKLLAFLSTIKTELSHHVNIMNMYNFSNDLPEFHQKLVRVVEDIDMTPSFRGRRVVSDQNQLPTITESPDSGKTIIHKKQHQSPPEDDADDAARKIWKDMRRDSKSTKDLLTMRSVTVSALSSRDERLAEIQRQALKSKRSIGTDTLRSFSLGTGSGEHQSRYAPWG